MAFFTAPSEPPRTKEDANGWRCLDCPFWELEGGAGWAGAVEMGKRHSQATGHRVVAWHWRLQRIEGGRVVYC